jgi:hypothetical protein
MSEELGPYVDRAEAGRLDAIAETLDHERPIPRAAFRAALGSHLADQAGQRIARRPERLRLAVGAYLASGFALLALAGFGLTGAGPLGY